MSYHCWFNTTSSVTKTLTVSTTDVSIFSHFFQFLPPKEKYWQPLTLAKNSARYQQVHRLHQHNVESTGEAPDRASKEWLMSTGYSWLSSNNISLSRSQTTWFFGSQNDVEPQSFKKASSQRWQLNQILQELRSPKTYSCTLDVRMSTFLYVHIHRNQLVPQFRQNKKNETISKNGFLESLFKRQHWTCVFLKHS